MNIAVAGGTGFIGKEIMRKLIADGHSIKALIRQGSLLKITRFKSTESRYVYYDSPHALKKSVADCQAIINLIGIIKETKETSFDFAHHLIPMSLIKAAQDSGVKRFIHMSALGAGGDMDTEYFQSKHQGENVIKESGLDWTIFRPSLVYGPEDHMVNMLAKMSRRLPLVPVVGDGKYEFMPVHVSNLAEAIAQSIDTPDTFGKIYDVPGPEKLNYNEILDRIAKARGKNKAAKIHQPLGLSILAAKLFGKLLPGPVSAEAIKMLTAGSVSDDNTFWSTFSTDPIYFSEGIREYIKK